MSSNVSPPWITKYLVNIAEIHGGDLLAVPAHSQSKKVQVVKFLTRQLPDSDNWIWAIISDTTSKVAVRFTKRAMKAYQENPLFKDKPFSSFKTALIQIKQFRPMFARIPADTKGMSSEEHIALEVDEFKPVGSFGANIWGLPKNVELAEEVAEWVQGMRAGSGGGNVLKLKRLEREQASSSRGPQREEQHVGRRDPSPQEAHSTAQIRRQESASRVKRIPGPSEGRMTRSKANGKKRGPLDPVKRVEWSKAARKPLYVVFYDELSDVHEQAEMVPRNSTKPAAAQDEVPVPRTPRRKRNALDLSTSPASPPPDAPSSQKPKPGSPVNYEADIERHRQHTPSEWSPSVYDGSQERDLERSDVGPMDEAQDEFESESEMDVEDRASPNPAGRRSSSAMRLELSQEVPVAGSAEEPPETMDIDDHPQNATQDDASELPSSSYPVPTPAQRPLPKPPFSSSLPTPGKVLVPDSTQQPYSQPIYTPSSLPFSSPIRPSQYPQSPDKGAASDTGVIITSAKVVRHDAGRMPRNRASSGVITSLEVSHGRILVPNSDTSGTTASQSQSQPSQQLLLSHVLPPSSLSQSADISPRQPEPSFSQTDAEPSRLPAPSDPPAQGAHTQEESQESQGLKSAQSLSYTSLSQSQSQGKEDAVQSAHAENKGAAQAHIQSRSELPLSVPPVHGGGGVGTDGLVEPRDVAYQGQNSSERPPSIIVEYIGADDHETRDGDADGQPENAVDTSSDDSTEPEDDSGDERMEVDIGLARRSRPLSAEEIAALRQEEEESQPQPAHPLVITEHPQGSALHEAQCRDNIPHEAGGAEPLDSDDERTDEAIRADVATNAPSTGIVTRPATVRVQTVDGDRPNAENSAVTSTPRHANTSTASKLLDSIKRLFSSGLTAALPTTSGSPTPICDSVLTTAAPTTLRGDEESHNTPSRPAAPPLIQLHDADAWKQPAFLRRRPAPVSVEPDTTPSAASPRDTSTRTSSLVTGGQRAFVSGTIHLASLGSNGNSAPAQVSVDAPIPTKSKKRRAPSDSSQLGTSARSTTTKRRRIVCQEPVSIPSSPEPPEPKALPARPDRPAATSIEVSPGSMRVDSRSSNTAQDSPTRRQSNKPPNGAHNHRDYSKPTVDSRSGSKHSAALPARGSVLPSSRPRDAARSPTKSTSLPSLSDKAKGKQLMRSSGPLVAPTRTVSTSSTRNKGAMPPSAPSAVAPTKSLPKMPKGLDLSMGPDDMGGMLVTWEKIDAGLLSIGRARYKERTSKMR